MRSFLAAVAVLLASSPSTSALAEDAPASPPKPRRLELGVAPMVIDGTARHGTGFGFFVELAMRLSLGKGAVTFGLRGSFERFALGHGESVSCAAEAAFGCTPGVNAYIASMRANVFGAGVPVTYRPLGVESRVQPYVGLLPQILFARTTERASGKQVVGAGSSEPNEASLSSTRVALTVYLGVVLQLAERHGLAAELGHRFAGTESLLQGPSSVRGEYVTFGYRHFF